MATTKVFVTDSLPDEARQELSGFEVYEEIAGDGALFECLALICWPSRAKPELLKKMERLRMVQSLSAGVDALDFHSLAAGASVFSNAGAFTDTVAEHAWGLLLGVAKGVHLRNVRTAPRALRGKTLLVVGAGSIGSEVARLSKSLGMKTIGSSRSFRSPEVFDEMHAISSLGQDIAAADAIAIALPLTNATRGIIDYRILSKAKEGRDRGRRRAAEVAQGEAREQVCDRRILEVRRKGSLHDQSLGSPELRRDTARRGHANW
jgi:D-3-phosphoglycerate dehydrogenase